MPAQEPSLPSVWARQRRQREQPALSREQIVTEAVRLLDAEGIDALSMRRLGTRLGAAATSIYWHVASKDELVELVVDAAYGELEVPDAPDPAGWRQAVTEFAHSLRSMILRHPWMASLLPQAGLAQLGPNLMRMIERMAAVLDAAGFSGREVRQAMNTVVAYALGVATTEAAWLTMLARAGESEQQWVARLYPAAEQAAQAYPRLREHYAAQRGADPHQTREEDFAYGLDRVLDGLAARLER
jgi:AcrR family transcriptional regulator